MFPGQRMVLFYCPDASGVKNKSDSCSTICPALIINTRVSPPADSTLLGDFFLTYIDFPPIYFSLFLFSPQRPWIFFICQSYNIICIIGGSSQSARFWTNFRTPDVRTLLVINEAADKVTASVCVCLSGGIKSYQQNLPQ